MKPKQGSTQNRMVELVRAAKAATMIPGAPVIDDAAILVNQGVIEAVGSYADLAPAHSGEVLDLGDVFLCPGLINAHSHLELAHLKGKCPSGQGFVTWVEDLLKQPIFDLEPDRLDEAVRELKRTGTIMVGDIATRFAKEMAGVLEASGLFFAVFCEAIGESLPKKTFIPKGEFEAGFISVAGHSLYTTHKDVLRAAKAEARDKGLPFSLHLAEHPEETHMMRDGSGPLPPMLEKARIGLDNFTPPGVSPTARARDLGLLDPDTLAVHCVQLSDDDLDILAETRANVCLCPRSNDYIGVGQARWEGLMERGVNLCLGTDGLCSNHDLDLFSEALYVRERIQADFPLETALAWMTSNPAKALNMDHKLGSLEPGKAARWCAVPPEVEQSFR